MINRTIKHKCGHTQEHKISEHGRNRIITRLELTLCEGCKELVIALIKQGKHTEAIELKHKLEALK